jgi:hypothetical protein
MKLIKMNNRWIQCRNWGHTAVIKFKSWGHQARVVELAIRDLTGSTGWFKGGEWYGWTGKAPAHLPRPYFISAKDESLLTMALLKAKLND